MGAAAKRRARNSGREEAQSVLDAGGKITIRQYCLLRSVLGGANALTRREANVLGVSHSQEKGWTKQPDMIDSAMCERMFAAYNSAKRSGIASAKSRAEKLAQKESKGITSLSRPPGWHKIDLDREYIISNEFLQSIQWRQARLLVLKRDGAKCVLCGATPASGAIMNVDHIKPRRLYPELALDLTNLQVLCHECNHGKGSWDHTDYRWMHEVHNLPF